MPDILQEPTIRITHPDGFSTGDIPMSVVGKALDVMKAGKGEQTDLEEFVPPGAGTKPRAETVADGSFGVAADRLRSLVDRIERLGEERKALTADIKDIFVEAKSAGFDVKVLRQLIRIRKAEPAEIEEQEDLLDVYRHALGM